MKRTVKDVMTADVITVHVTTPYKDVVRVIEVAGVSAVPVLDLDDRLVGIISQDDLLLKEAHTGEPRRRFRSGRHRLEHNKASGTQAWQLMNAPVVTTRPDASIAESARAMHGNGVKRLPVVDDDGTLVGIVSRKDLLKVFMRPDAEIEAEVVEDVIRRKLWLAPHEGQVQVSVDDGIVRLEGWIDRKSAMQLLVDLVGGVEGLVGVDNRLRYETDDTRLRPATPAPFGVLPHGLRWP